jgi:hypothetical protein
MVGSDVVQRWGVAGTNEWRRAVMRADQQSTISLNAQRPHHPMPDKCWRHTKHTRGHLASREIMLGVGVSPAGVPALSRPRLGVGYRATGRRRLLVFRTSALIASARPCQKPEQLDTKSLGQPRRQPAGAVLIAWVYVPSGNLSARAASVGRLKRPSNSRARFRRRPCSGSII